MRSIGYRAWDKKNKQMLTVTSIVCQTIHNPLITQFIEGRNKAGDYYCLKFEDVELFEYTGLHDCNDKPIYEGDIVKMLDDWIDHYKLYSNHSIEFGSGTFRLENGVPLYDCLDAEKDFEQCSFEIIGNKYSNPELLRTEQ